jgi:hypothetical protein
MTRSRRPTPSTPGREICSKCDCRFSTRSAIVDWGDRAGFVRLPQIPPRVRCPGCSHAFLSTGIRYFDFIPADTLRTGLVAYVALMLLSTTAFVFWPHH